MVYLVLSLFNICFKMFYSNKTPQLAFEHFRSLKCETPRSKMAVLRSLYPEISAARLRGHTLKDIHERLVEDGLEISYTVLLTYINRIRRGKARAPFVQTKRPPAFPVSTEMMDDPLANAMKALSKPRYDIRKAMCDGDPTKKKLI
jgi:hypothetical protein